MNRKKLCLLPLVVSEAVEFVVGQIDNGAVPLFGKVRAVHLAAGLASSPYGLNGFSAGRLKGKSAVQTGGECRCKRERMPR